MKATEVLAAAAATLEQRGAERDLPDGERSMARAVEAFNELTQLDLSERDGWVLLLCLKLSRGYGGKPCADDWLDAVGYAALTAESAAKQAATGGNG